MEKIFESIGYEGNYQTLLIKINLLTGSLPIIYPLQIPYLTKYPNFFVTKRNEPNKIYEMEYSHELCDSSLYQILKKSKKINY